MGIPIVRGRAFDERDAPGAPLSAIVNDSMARRFWPHGDALGKRVVWGGWPLTIVGMAGDVHLTGSRPPSIRRSTRRCIRLTEAPPATPCSSSAHGRGASILAPAVRQAIWSVDSGVPVFDLRAMEDVVARSLATRRFTVSVLSAFAALALMLAVVGLYSVLAYAVTQRTPELGLRLALGAAPRQLLGLVIGDGVRLTCVGLALGIPLATALSRSMAQLLLRGRAVRPARIRRRGGASAA